MQILERLKVQKNGITPPGGSSTDGHRQSDRAELFTRTGGGEEEGDKKQY